jgi:hypothetical protein
MDMLAELQTIERKNNEAKISKAKLEQKEEQLTEALAKAKEELVALGVTEEDIVHTLENLEIDIENDINELKEGLK